MGGGRTGTSRAGSAGSDLIHQRQSSMASGSSSTSASFCPWICCVLHAGHRLVIMHMWGGSPDAMFCSSSCTQHAKLLAETLLISICLCSRTLSRRIAGVYSLPEPQWIRILEGYLRPCFLLLHVHVIASLLSRECTSLSSRTQQHLASFLLLCINTCARGGGPAVSGALDRPFSGEINGAPPFSPFAVPRGSSQALSMGEELGGMPPTSPFGFGGGGSGNGGMGDDARFSVEACGEEIMGAPPISPFGAPSPEPGKGCP